MQKDKILLPEELLQIQNPEVRKLYESSYEIFDITLNSNDYQMFLDKHNDYVVKIEYDKIKVIAKHNVNIENVINSKSFLMKFSNDVWVISDLRSFVDRCLQCLQYFYRNDECLSCKEGLVLSKKFIINSSVLYLPIRTEKYLDEETEPDQGRLKVYVHDSECLRLIDDIDINLATTKDIAWTSRMSVEESDIGKYVTLVYKRTEPFNQYDSLDLINDLETISFKGSEKYRPQLRFSQLCGWNNDPNGLVYHKGEYHMFWQHNPFGKVWGNMYWGHSTSTDLIHWKELKPALKSRTSAKGLCFSGSAYSYNEELLMAFTDTQKGEILGYLDQDAIFKAYKKNPIIKHMGRDPKLLRYKKGQNEWWVIVVYEIFNDKIEEKERSGFAFYRSYDLKQWEKTGFIEGFFECPELIQAKITCNLTKWVLFGADSEYMIGDFDGLSFIPDHKEKKKLHYGKFKASQVFNNVENRNIQIGWATIDIDKIENKTNTSSFNQAFSLPIELSLRYYGDNLLLHAEPIKELEQLRTLVYEKEKIVLSKDTFDVELFNELYDITILFKVSRYDQKIIIKFGKNKLMCDVLQDELIGHNDVKMPLNTPYKENGFIYLRLIVDRPMFEICNGSFYYTEVREDPGEILERLSIKLLNEQFDDGSKIEMESIKIYQMKSINEY